MKPTIIIADDHAITAKGMESTLIELGFSVLGNHQNGINALNDILLQKPDYVLLDVRMPGMSGLDIAEVIKQNSITCKVIIYTMFTELTFYERAKSLGVSGYLLKEFALEDLEKCIKSIENTGVWHHPMLEQKLKASKNVFSPELYAKLTTRERYVLEGIADSKSTKAIAEELFVSQRTVESHRRSIIQKLQLPKKKNALLMWALENKGFFGLMDD